MANAGSSREVLEETWHIRACRRRPSHLRYAFQKRLRQHLVRSKAHALQPQAARLPFSSQTSAIAIMTR